MTARDNDNVTFKDLIEKIDEAIESIGAPTEASNLLGQAFEIAEVLEEKYEPTVN